MSNENGDKTVLTSVVASMPSPATGVWEVGPFPIRAYALSIIVGIAVAIVMGERRWQARGGEAGLITDLALWAASMEKLLALRPDVLCEGHYGIFRPWEAVERFIRGHLRQQGF